MFEYLMKKYIDEKMNCDIEPSFTTRIPGFVYIHIPINYGPINESQYEIKIIDNNLDRALQKRNELIELLNFEMSKPSIQKDDITFRSLLAGGGQLFNDDIQVWELSLIFIVKWRIKNGK